MRLLDEKLVLEDVLDTQDNQELEQIIRELKGEAFNVYRRTLPSRESKTVALNVPTFKDALILVKAMKLKTKIEENEDETKEIVFYDIVPNTVKMDNLLWNDAQITTIGNKRKDVAQAYFDIGD